MITKGHRALEFLHLRVISANNRHSFYCRRDPVSDKVLFVAFSRNIFPLKASSDIMWLACLDRIGTQQLSSLLVTASRGLT